MHQLKHFGFEILQEAKHESHHFTQGLTFREVDGALIEGIGEYGKSKVILYESLVFNKKESNNKRRTETTNGSGGGEEKFEIKSSIVIQPTDFGEGKGTKKKKV